MSALTIETPITAALIGRPLKPVDRVRPLRAPAGKPRRPLHPGRPVSLPVRPAVACAATSPGRLVLTNRGIAVVLGVFLTVMAVALVVLVGSFLAVPNDPIGSIPGDRVAAVAP